MSSWLESTNHSFLSLSRDTLYLLHKNILIEKGWLDYVFTSFYVSLSEYQNNWVELCIIYVEGKHKTKTLIYKNWRNLYSLSLSHSLLYERWIQTEMFVPQKKTRGQFDSSSSKRRAERMYFWLCKMRDCRLQPDPHTVKHFKQMNLYFPAADEPFWTTDFGMPFDPQRHSRRLR